MYHKYILPKNYKIHSKFTQFQAIVVTATLLHAILEHHCVPNALLPIQILGGQTENKTEDVPSIWASDTHMGNLNAFQSPDFIQSQPKSLWPFGKLTITSKIYPLSVTLPFK